MAENIGPGEQYLNCKPLECWTVSGTKSTSLLVRGGCDSLKPSCLIEFSSGGDRLHCKNGNRELALLTKPVCAEQMLLARSGGNELRIDAIELDIDTTRKCAQRDMPVREAPGAARAMIGGSWGVQFSAKHGGFKFRTYLGRHILQQSDTHAYKERQLLISLPTEAMVRYLARNAKPAQLLRLPGSRAALT